MSSPIEPSLPTVVRLLPPPAARRRALGIRTLWASAVAGLALPLGVVVALAWRLPSPLLWALGLAVALALVATVGARPGALAWAVTAFGGAVGAELVLGWSGLFAAGGLAGLALARRQSWEERTQAALLGMSLVGASVAVMARLAPAPWFEDEWVQWAVGPGAAGLGMLLGASIGLVHAWTRVDRQYHERIPSRRVIASTIGTSRRPRVLQAWELDRLVARSAPDDETRDGLGEVAAWVYRLAWTAEHLDREVDALELQGIDTRIVEGQDRLAQTSDPFVRERREATLQHLRQLKDHRAALQRESDRTDALFEYASAFLEEARTGLTLARVQPGTGMPDGLDVVLGRLRDYGRDREAERRTARELALARAS